MPPPTPLSEAPLLLIAAISGRALAASARRGGYRPVVLDCFADRDTRAAAVRWCVVAAPESLHFDRRRLLDAAVKLSSGAPLVYGAGFEARVPLLRQLGTGRELLGNPPDVIRKVKDPRRFFSLLDALGIRHPDVRSQRPGDSLGWLVKRGGGAGGTHIRGADDRPLAAGEYFQRLESGRAMSALFLADGRRALILGFNAQWARIRPGLPYLFGGAVSRVPISTRVAASIEKGLDALVAATGLVGVNGLDFLLEGEDWSVLEINPRPTATMELYDPDYERGLVACHVEACRGALPSLAAGGPARALSIVHADVGWQVDPAFGFPTWCRDIPNAGTILRPGDPICTAHAEADDPEAAMALVRDREGKLRRMIGS